MDWSDEGIILAVRKHGESSAIVTALTALHGRYVGLVRGGGGRRHGGTLQPGNQVALFWRARLAEHLGNYRVELLRARAAAVLDEPAKLLAVSAACSILDRVIPEHEPVPELLLKLVGLLDAIETASDWPSTYVHWELWLLGDLGYALDLSRCAVSGATEGLTFVSPRTGRAVTAQAASPYQDRLLSLPPFLTRAPGAAPAPGPVDIAAGLGLTGYFLLANVFARPAKNLPAARLRLLDYFQALATKSGN